MPTDTANPAATTAAGFVDPAPPTRLELHAGVRLSPRTGVPGTPAWDGRHPDLRADPRSALEAAVRRVLARGPAVVQFSGGRDSSLVLAVAVHVARREGLPLPEVVSLRYGLASTDESSWQDLVTSHLGVPLRVVQVEPAAHELTGPFALSRMLRHGPLLPPTAAVNAARIADLAQGRPVMTGEGGDSVLGAVRISQWAAIVRRRQVPRGAVRRQLLEDVLPGPLRRRAVRTRFAAAPPAPWLRPEAQRVVVASLAEEAAAVPWDWRDATWAFFGQKICAGYATMGALSAAEGFELQHPLMDPSFVEALCRRAGFVGYRSRTAIMRLLGSDLLPEALLDRTGKASFNEVFAGDGVRAFAATWDGAGVDERLVDVERLRRAWSAPLVPALSLAPLQLALGSRAGRTARSGNGS